MYYQTPGYKDEPVCAFVADFQKDDMNGSAICDLLLYENFQSGKDERFCNGCHTWVIRKLYTGICALMLLLHSHTKSHFYSMEDNKNGF